MHLFDYYIKCVYPTQMFIYEYCLFCLPTVSLQSHTISFKIKYAWQKIQSRTCLSPVSFSNERQLMKAFLITLQTILNRRFSHLASLPPGAFPISCLGALHTFAKLVVLLASFPKAMSQFNLWTSNTRAFNFFLLILCRSMATFVYLPWWRLGLCLCNAILWLLVTNPLISPWVHTQPIVLPFLLHLS